MPDSLRKNCYNCQFVEYYAQESWDLSGSWGWCCERKDFASGREEDEMIRNMDREEYRLKGKVCHSPAKSENPSG